jgi:hypothetical protein
MNDPVKIFHPCEDSNLPNIVDAEVASVMRMKPKHQYWQDSMGEQLDAWETTVATVSTNHANQTEKVALDGVIDDG